MLPTGPLARLVSNVNATSIFKKSKAQKKHIIKEPEWDVAADKIAMSAIVQERNNAEIIEQQEKMREESKVKAKQNKIRIEELRKMQEDLRQKFIEANNFICECEEKEAAVEKKIAMEEEVGEKLQTDLDDLQTRYESLSEWNENEFQPSIKELKVYEEVLQKVVDDSDLFKSKEDFLDRCDALLLTQSEVAKNDAANLKAIEELQADIVKTSNEATLIIAGFESELNDLQKQVEKAQAECLKWESMLPPTKEIIAEEEKEAQMLLDQVQQLYTLLCERAGIEPTFKREQVEEQMDFIKTEMEIVLDIIEMSREMMALEDRSDIAEHGSGKSGKPRK